MLTELALVSGIEILGLSFAGLLARWILRLPSGDAEARRLVGATTRAAEAFQWRANKLTGALVAGIAAVLVAAWTYQVLTAETAPASGAIAWRVIALLLGAGSASLVGYVAAQLTVRGALRAACAARVSMDHVTAVSMRSAGAVGLIADAVGVGGPAFLFGLVYLLQGGPARAGSELQALLTEAAAVVPFYGLGAAAAAILLHSVGSAYHAAGRVGGALTGERDGALGPSDVRNPALVADLVGKHVGLAAGRAIDGFLAGCIANVAAVGVGVSVLRQTDSDHALLWGVLTLPFVVRALGVIATAFGVLTARAAEQERADLAWVRGQVTTIIVSVGGQAGACFWLLGEDYWLPFFMAAAGATVLTHATAHGARYLLDRMRAPVRAVSECLRAGPAITLGRALAGGLTGTWAGVGGLGLALSGAWFLGTDSGIPGGELVAVAAALSGALSATAYLVALGVLGPITSTALSVGSIERLENEEGHRRADLLDDAAFVAGSVSQAFFIVVGIAGGLLGALALSSAAHAHANPASPSPIVLGSGLLGAMVVLLASGSTLSAAARAARGAAIEVERQLRGFPRLAGQAQIPSDYTPSYRALIDQTTRLALQSPLFPVIVVIAAVGALGFGLRLLYSSGGLVFEALASFAVIASVTGLTTALAAEGVRVTVEAVHRANRPRGSSTGFDVSLTGHAFADLVGNSVAPAAHFAARAATVGALVVATMFI